MKTITYDKLYFYAIYEEIEKHPLLKPVANKLKTLFLPLEDFVVPETVLQQARHWALSNKIDTILDIKDLHALSSIFSSMDGANKKTFYKPQKIVFSEDYFPSENYNQKLNTASVDVQIKHFCDELDKIPRGYKEAAETLLALLQYYTSTIPEAYTANTDVSFYDFIRLKAGLTISLQKAEEQGSLSEKEPLLLLGGDISGIQSFIYDIVSKNAAKNLKGRSFYLQLLVDSIVQKIIQDLNLYRGNIVYDSGGGFFLIAPNTQEVEEKLQDIDFEIASKIFKTHQSTLFLALDTVAFGKNQVFPTQGRLGLSELWGSLHQKLAIRKKRRFANLFEKSVDKQFEKFFEPSPTDGKGTQLQDVITGDEILQKEAKNREVYFIGERSSQPQRLPEKASNNILEVGLNEFKTLKKATAEQIMMGSQLFQSDFIISQNSEISGTTSNETFNPCGLGNYYTLVTSKKIALKYNDFFTKNSNLLVRKLNYDTGSLLYQNPNVKEPPNHIFAFDLYGGNQQPQKQMFLKKGTKVPIPQTFSNLAGVADEEDVINTEKEEQGTTFSPEFGETRFKRLGVLRMDVDNLGTLFQSGLGTRASFARYACLSRSMDYFFKGHLNHIWAEGNLGYGVEEIEFKKRSLILYAGGDDLFLIGRWDIMIAFAKAINENFAKYVGYNTKLKLSGGMSAVGAKFPIMKAAQICEDAEKVAKQHEYKIEENGKEYYFQKNAFTLFGVPLNWEQEFPIVENLKDEFVVFGKKTRSILQKVQAHYQQYEYQTQKATAPSWKWNIAYDFAQIKDRYRDNELRQFIDRLSTDIFCNKYSRNPDKKTAHTMFKLINLAARWAELEIRSTNN
ncbi:MAG: hypothetical protein JJT94_01035 [Bernardetiaceae bacterium]|nr:hypothetical protein [Bernardetiaceae bacterium]